MPKKIYGVYPSLKEAEGSAGALIASGCPAGSILVLTDNAPNETLANGVKVESIGEDHYRSLWERFKNYFGFEDFEDFEASMLEEYSAEVDSGKTLVFVEEDYLSHLANEVISKDSAKLAMALPKDFNNEDIIRLVEERLRISKETVKKGEVRLRRVIRETKETVTVPVFHEELVIERVTDGCAVALPEDFSEITYTIPLTEEKVLVNKDPVVTAEYRLTKKAVEGAESVSGTLRKEELIDGDGKVISK